VTPNVFPTSYAWSYSHPLSSPWPFPFPLAGGAREDEQGRRAPQTRRLRLQSEKQRLEGIIYFVDDRQAATRPRYTRFFCLQVHPAGFSPYRSGSRNAAQEFIRPKRLGGTIYFIDDDSSYARPQVRRGPSEPTLCPTAGFSDNNIF